MTRFQRRLLVKKLRKRTTVFKPVGNEVPGKTFTLLHEAANQIEKDGESEDFLVGYVPGNTVDGKCLTEVIDKIFTDGVGAIDLKYVTRDKRSGHGYEVILRKIKKED